VSPTDQAHQCIALIFLLAIPVVLLLAAMELLAHPMIVRHGCAQSSIHPRDVYKNRVEASRRCDGCRLTMEVPPLFCLPRPGAHAAWRPKRTSTNDRGALVQPVQTRPQFRGLAVTRSTTPSVVIKSSQCPQSLVVTLSSPLGPRRGTMATAASVQSEASKPFEQVSPQTLGS